MIAVALAAAGTLLVSVTADEVLVPQAVVEIRRAGQDPVVTRGSTGPDGRASALELPAGIYDVEIHTKTFPFALVENAVVRAGDSFPLAIALDTLSNRYVPGEKYPAIDGIVLDAHERPVAGAVVAGWIQTIHFGEPTTPARIHTATDGTFRLGGVPDQVTVEVRRGSEGDRRLVCRRDGCETRTILRLRPDFPPPTPKEPKVFEWTARPSYLTEPGSHLHVTIPGLPGDAEIVFALLPVSRRTAIPVRALAKVFAGRTCLDCYPSRGLPWQRFRVHGGEIDLDGVPDDPVDLRAETKMGNAEARIAPDRNARNVMLAVAGRATIRGLARYAQNGRIAPGRVCLSDPLTGDELRCVSFEDGRFDLTGLPAGPRRLTVTSFDTRPWVRDVEAREGEILDLGDIQLPSK